ncbi:UDP-glucose:undecaprenyl-phosphate glucose-1-phosphate transferase [Planctomycetes bacterium Poly30]|uniref:UDP-glucose:undecaprenyl-phosphate glucose-1-phosphate transferase n=1 Tax=Saltatorellus ferox TaxID=2528018 RepID=A0A518ERQ6_9BACT|nr:UDP-glucose:undecaprenyl-phosphate glucose-1-phosphate transferase [Planctomycetes bacterium Poly30]
MSAAGTILRRNFEPLVLSVQVVIDLVVVVMACLLAWWLRETLVASEVLGPVADMARTAGEAIAAAPSDVAAGAGGPSADQLAGAPRYSTPLSDYREVFSITAAVCLVCFHSFGLYSPSKSLLNVEEYKAVTKSSVFAFFVVLVLLFFLRDAALPAEDVRGIYEPLLWLHGAVDLNVEPDELSRLTLLLSFLFILAFMTISRFMSFRVIQRLHQRGIGNRNVLVIGAGWTGRKLQEKFLHVPTLGLNFVGFVDPDPALVGTWIGRGQVLATTDNLKDTLGRHKVGEVFISLPEAKEALVMDLCAQLDALGTPFYVVPRFYHLMSYNVRIENLDSIPLITRTERRESLASLAVKRVFDICVSLFVLLLTLPLFLVIAFVIRRESDGPIFFRQTRIGQGGRPFDMMKFRTMHVANCTDAVAPKSENDPRVTKVGRILRRYSLDELPNFINVIKGEMSVVGPRPEMPFIVETYNAVDRERLRAKPGITGLWQISYARQDAIHSNLDYDLYYIENRSFLLDLVIVALTGFAVAKGTGAF